MPQSSRETGSVKVRRTILACFLLSALSVARVEATPIVFIFEGTGTGLLGATRFTAAPFIITAIADTRNIVTSATADGARAGDFSLDTNFSRIAIAGIGTLAFTVGTRLFDARDATINSQGPLDFLAFARAGLNGVVLMDFANSAFATYDLATPFGPLFLGNAIGVNPIGTTRGNLGFDQVTDVTFAARLIPEPGTLALLGIALAGLGFARYRKLS